MLKTFLPCDNSFFFFFYACCDILYTLTFPIILLQCINLVDYYAPLLFLEVSEVQPQEFCQRIGLCGQVVSILQHIPKGNCEFCHQVVAEALEKLKDPETQVFSMPLS